MSTVPFTPAERVILGRHCDVYEAYGTTKPVTKAYLVTRIRRYEATVCQAEAELARVNNNLDALLAERDGIVRERGRLQDSNRALHLEVRGLMEKLDEVAP